jgi:hypothetical protein
VHKKHGERRLMRRARSTARPGRAAEHVLLGATRVREPALDAALQRCGRTADELRAALLAAMDQPGAAAG